MVPAFVRLMNSDLLYAILMSVGWIFLFGWLALLLVACGLAFRTESRLRPGRPRFANGCEPELANKVSWGIHWRN